MHHLSSKAAIAAFMAAVLALPAAADRRQRGRDPHDHDSARSAVARGEVLPLSEILKGIRGRVGGDIVSVEIEHENGRWVYEFRVADKEGHLSEVYVDGRTGQILKTEEK